MHALAPAEEYRPEAHTSQTPAPVDAEYFPAQHEEHSEASAEEYKPWAQFEQTVAFEEEYFPAEHATQALLASSDVYFPAEQLVQSTPRPSVDDAVPAVHFTHAIDPEKEYMPAEHSPQPIEFVEAENLPAEHKVQFDDRTAEYWPSPQFEQTLVFDAEYLPAEQSLQDTADPLE